MPDCVTVSVRPSVNAMAPEPVRPVVVMLMSPVLVWVVVKLALRVTVPPSNETAPATVVVLAKVILAVLLALPIVKPPKVLPKLQPLVLKALAKLSLTDRIVKAPVVFKLKPEPKFMASALSVTAPVVLPETPFQPKLTPALNLNPGSFTPATPVKLMAPEVE